MAQTLGRDAVMFWLVYSVPSNVWRPPSPSPHMAPRPRAFLSHEATIGIDIQCMRSIASYPLIELGSHGLNISSCQTSLRAGN